MGVVWEENPFSDRSGKGFPSHNSPEALGRATLIRYFTTVNLASAPAAA